MITLLYGPAAVGLWCFLVAPAWSYLATPVYRVFGVFKYQSAFLRTSPGNEPGSVSLHLGTLYDVLWHVVPLRRSTEPVAATVRRELYRGLSGICDRIASGDIRGDASISVCTHYLLPAQMSALGFSEDRSGEEARLPTTAARFSFTMAYLDLMLARTLVLGRVRWFNPFCARFYRASAARFAENEAFF